MYIYFIYRSYPNSAISLVLCHAPDKSISQEINTYEKSFIGRIRQSRF
jgi:hypothetical protein